MEIKIKYPQLFGFQLVKDTNTNKLNVSAIQLGTKVKRENIKFNAVKSFSYDGQTHFAVISVKEINNQQELRDELRRLQDIWVLNIANPFIADVSNEDLNIN
jgi:hypothetical protein